MREVEHTPPAALVSSLKHRSGKALYAAELLSTGN